MVQIILRWDDTREGNIFKSFISHMVQIIPDYVTLTIDKVTVFISHMVQIIQITHGTGSGQLQYFISHMVQIIHLVSVRFIPIRITLYPTWFR